MEGFEIVDVDDENQESAADEAGVEAESDSALLARLNAGDAAEAQNPPSPSIPEPEIVAPEALQEIVSEGNPPGPLETLLDAPGDPHVQVGLTAEDAGGVLALLEREMREAGYDPGFVEQLDPHQIVDVMLSNGLHGVQGFRELVTALGIQEASRQRDESDARWRQAIEQQLTEQKSFEPGSAYDQLNRKIDGLLAERQQQQAIEQVVAQQQAWVQERVPVHAQAFEMLAAEATRRGLAVPDMQECADVGAQLLHLPPMEAARIAWLAGNGDPSVFNKRPSRAEGRIVSRTIVGGDVPTHGEPPRFMGTGSGNGAPPDLRLMLDREAS